jgi:alanyl-tRNA synthetase
MKPEIRIVEIEGWDTEACYGTHVSNTGEIGSFKIVSVERIQDGVVRFEYVAGGRVSERARELEDLVGSLSSMIGTTPDGLESRLESLLKSHRELEQALREYRSYWARSVEERVKSREPVGGVRVAAVKLLERDPRSARSLMKRLTSQHPDLILAAIYPGVPATIELAMGEEAARLVGPASQVAAHLASSLGGRGGGGKTFASMSVAGQVEPGRVEDLLVRLVEQRAGRGASLGV